MDAEDSAELQSLRAFYADLDPSIVDAVWAKNDHDYGLSMEELAEVAKNPNAFQGLSPRGETNESYPMPTSRSAADLGSPGGPSSRIVTSHEEEQSAFSWDAVAATLTDWGQSVSDSIIGLADNISDFVSDLASAVDAGWEGDEPPHTEKPEHRASDRDAAVVSHVGSQRVSNRRQAAAPAHGMTADRQDSVGEGDDSKYD